MYTNKNDDDCGTLQSDVDKLKEWTDKWLIKVNVDKCQVVSYGRNISINNTNTIMVADIKDNVEKLEKQKI